MPALGNRPAERVIVPRKPAPRAPAPKVYARPRPAPKPAPAFSRSLQKTFGPLAKKGVGAPSKLASKHVQEEAPGGRLYKPQAHTIFGIPLPWKEESKAEKQQIARVPRSTGMVVPPTGVARFAAGSAVAGKALKLSEPKGGGFIEKFWNSAAETLANMPASTLEAAKNPVGTLKGMAHLYTHPEQSWKENSAGTLLAFLAPAAAAERGAGAVVRGVSKGRLLSLERPDLTYSSGQPQAREWQPGLVSGSLQRLPGAVAKAVGKGEKPVRPKLPEAVPVESRGTWESPHEVPLHQIDKSLKPDSQVTIYRVQTGNEIKPGKGVTLEPPAHGFAPHQHVESMKVPASAVFGARDGAVNQFGVREYGYHPASTAPVQVPAELPHGIHEVSGGEFVKAVEKARSESALHENNLTPHPASDYHKAFLTADGKAGVAVVKTGKTTRGGKPEVELVNLFNHGGPKGAGHALEDVAVHAGANKLDALEGYLTDRYAAKGWKVVKVEPWDEQYGPAPKPGQQIFHMVRREVNQATKLQERRQIVGGIVRPGQVDLIRSGERLAHNLETMKRHDFLRKYLPEDKAHGTAVMALLEGVARRPETFWHDIAERKAELIERARELSGKELAYNKAQVAALDHLEQNRDKISNEDLQHHAESAHKIGAFQANDWRLLNQEGIGEPGQLNARNLTAVLQHGHLLNRGDLQFVAKPGPDPLVDMARKADQEAAKAKKQAQILRAEIRGRVVPKGVKQGQQFKLDEVVANAEAATQRAAEYRRALEVKKYARAVQPNGDQFPGVYDAQGERVSPADVQKLINEHLEGREMGFVTQRQDRVQAQSQNTYSPRSAYPMRTGGNFRAGAYDNSPAALRNHFDRVAANLATMRGHRSVAENLVKVNDNGKPFEDQHQAELAADNANSTEGGEHIQHHLGKWVAYNLGANKVAKLIEGHPYGKVLEQEGLVEHHALSEEQGAWGIIPEKVAERLTKWDSVEKQVAHSPLRLMTTPWRQTNLYTSVRWPWGTTQENAIRLAAHQVSPLVVLPFGKHTSISFGTGSHIVKFLDEKINDPTISPMQKQLATFHRAQFGTGNFVGSQLHELEPALHHLEENSKWRLITESPPNTKVWRPYRRFVGNSLARMETNAKVAAGGKLARQDQAFFDKFKKMSSEQAARNYVEKITRDPAQSIRQAQHLMDIMGNWNHLTPMTRQAQAEFAPFALWWLNSAKFIFQTMPKDHPYATGLLAAMVTANGLANRDLKAYLTGTVPLRLPLLGDINVNPVHYSPFDIAHEPLHTASGMIAPQIVEPVEEAKGIDPLTGDKFVRGEGSEDISLGHLTASGLGSYIPGVRLASQLARRGGRVPKKAYLPWEIEPGTSEGIGKAAAKTFAPFMFTYDKTKRTSGKQGTGGSYAGAGAGYGGGAGYGSGGAGYGK